MRFAHIVDGRKPHSLLLELFTDAGIGTKVGGSVRASGAQTKAVELEARYMMQTYKRLPVTFVMRRGVPSLRRARASQYLDFLAGISVLQRRALPPARG